MVLGAGDRQDSSRMVLGVGDQQDSGGMVLGVGDRQDSSQTVLGWERAGAELQASGSEMEEASCHPRGRTMGQSERGTG